MTLLTAPIAKNIKFLAGIYFIFLNVLNQFWKSFDTKFGPQSKNLISSYQVRQNLALFWNLVALILGWNYAKGFIVTKFVKKNKFEGAWGKLEVKITVGKDWVLGYDSMMFWDFLDLS